MDDTTFPRRFSPVQAGLDWTGRISYIYKQHLTLGNISGDTVKPIFLVMILRKVRQPAANLSATMTADPICGMLSLEQFKYGLGQQGKLCSLRLKYCMGVLISIQQSPRSARTITHQMD
jgi:hypothetical protein